MFIYIMKWSQFLPSVLVQSYYNITDYILYAEYYIHVTYLLYSWRFAHSPTPYLLETSHWFSVSMREKHTGPQTVAFLAQIPSWTFAFLGEDTLISHSYPALGTTVSGCLRSCVIRYYCHTNPSLTSLHKLSFLDPPCSLYRQWF